jgi:GNAT superfamily N-acetyltransferase
MSEPSRSGAPTVRIEDLRERIIDDRISVCGDKQPVEQPAIRKGIKEKKRWLRRMLRNSGPPSKVLYVDGHPEGQIQFYPESSIPFIQNPDPKNLHVMCSFVHLPQQGKGYGKKLFNSLLENVKSSGQYERLETLSFDPPGCGLAQTVFWKRLGFRERPEGRPNELQYAVKGELTKPIQNNPKIVKEKGVKIFYEPTCIFTHYFDDKAVEIIRAIDPKVSVEKIDMWDRPRIAKNRGVTQGCIYINGRPMKHSFFEGEEFKKEAQGLLGSTNGS